MSYASAILSDKPVGYWRLGDTGSIAGDSSGGAHDGTLNGAIIRGVAGATADGDAAMSFNGNGYISVPDSSAFHPRAFSLEAWFYKTADSSFQRILAEGTTPSSAYGLLADSAGDVY